ncbi:hypothetical protein [Rhizobium laguerreae]|uniref:hypothetical protein n=1 Tax=Rhizobium laguerreae TaxID=1076926 RepID=UPI0021B13E96|nr:hypothetical protein [Rhizobium laguerreae]
MPGMNGDALAARSASAVKILLTPGFSESHAVEKEIEAGAWLAEEAVHRVGDVDQSQAAARRET